MAGARLNEVRLNGTQLAYIDEGRGEPVVLVHGSLEDYRHWKPQVDAFSQQYRTISYSRRYHHPNPWDEGGPDYTPELHADDLAGLLEALGLESAHVVGHSYGAEIALMLALRHPHRVRTLVLGEPLIWTLIEHDEEARQLHDYFVDHVEAPVVAVLRRGEQEEGVRQAVDAVVAEGAFDQLEDEVRNLYLDNAAALEAELASPHSETNLGREESAGVTAPTLLLNGETSEEVFRLIADELEQCLPTCERATVPSASHNMEVENPGAYNELVLAFLGRHSR